jgi:hypothetical protein
MVIQETEYNMINNNCLSTAAEIFIQTRKKAII